MSLPTCSRSRIPPSRGAAAAAVSDMRPASAIAIVTVLLAICRVHGQVTSEHLLNAAKMPWNWLTYSGGYESRRHSELRQLTPANVANLEQKWIFQGSVVGTWQATPLVVDGIM